MLDLNRRLGSMFMAIALVSFAGIAAAIPWFGWQPLIAPTVGGIVYYLIRWQADRLPTPTGCCRWGSRCSRPR